MNYLKLRLMRSFKPLNRAFWKIRPSLVSSPLICGAWQSFCEKGRLTLPALQEDFLHRLALEEVIIPGTRDPGHGQDAPLADLLCLLQLAQALRPKRLLEVGTYRAKTTYAFHRNLPGTEIVSYDIMRVDSPYRSYLESHSDISLRIEDFSRSEDLRNEAPFDFIFIDAGHRYKEVLDDSAKCFEVLSPHGCIVWHDYRINEFLNPGLEVPEALGEISQRFPIYSIPGTTCAIYSQNPSILAK